VAACLIFAIQKIEAAPFYIMDEFDSALDATYCQGIADQIKRLSQSHQDEVNGEIYPGSQFIMTTHKPAMINVADKILEVTFRA
jgi:chromosome segregation ATPase